MPLRARLARRAPVWVNALKSAGYTAALWSVFLVVLPAVIKSLEDRLGWNWAQFAPGRWEWAAVALFTVAGLIGLWAGWLLVTRGGGTPMPLECPHRLVIAGPYRYIRNPMSALGIFQGIMVGVFLGSILVIAYAVAGSVVWNFVFRPWEEQDMTERFGQDFQRYRNHVRCWIPRLTPYTIDDRMNAV